MTKRYHGGNTDVLGMVYGFSLISLGLLGVVGVAALIDWLV